MFMQSLLFLRLSNYDQKLYEMQYLKHSCVQKYEKFADHNLAKLCIWSLALASTIPALVLESACP